MNQNSTAPCSGREIIPDDDDENDSEDSVHESEDLNNPDGVPWHQNRNNSNRRPEAAEPGDSLNSATESVNQV